MDFRDYVNRKQFDETTCCRSGLLSFALLCSCLFLLALVAFICSPLLSFALLCSPLLSFALLCSDFHPFGFVYSPLFLFALVCSPLLSFALVCLEIIAWINSNVRVHMTQKRLRCSANALVCLSSSLRSLARRFR